MLYATAGYLFVLQITNPAVRCNFLIWQHLSGYRMECRLGPKGGFTIFMTCANMWVNGDEVGWIYERVSLCLYCGGYVWWVTGAKAEVHAKSGTKSGGDALRRRRIMKGWSFSKNREWNPMKHIGHSKGAKQREHCLEVRNYGKKQEWYLKGFWRNQ
jgi:hypothetical protein